MISLRVRLGVAFGGTATTDDGGLIAETPGVSGSSGPPGGRPIPVDRFPVLPHLRAAATPRGRWRGRRSAAFGTTIVRRLLVLNDHFDRAVIVVDVGGLLGAPPGFGVLLLEVQPAGDREHDP